MFAGLVEDWIVSSDDFVTFDGSHDGLLFLMEKGNVVIGHLLIFCREVRIC